MSSFSLQEYQNFLSLSQYFEFTNAMKYAIEGTVFGTPLLGLVLLAQFLWRKRQPSLEIAEYLQHILYGKLVGFGFGLFIWSLLLAFLGIYVGYSASGSRVRVMSYPDLDLVFFYIAAILLITSNTLLLIVKRIFLKRMQSNYATQLQSIAVLH